MGGVGGMLVGAKAIAATDGIYKLQDDLRSLHDIVINGVDKEEHCVSCGTDNSAVIYNTNPWCHYRACIAVKEPGEGKYNAHGLSTVLAGGVVIGPCSRLHAYAPFYRAVDH